MQRERVSACSEKVSGASDDFSSAVKFLSHRQTDRQTTEQRHRHTVELVLPWRGDASAPLTSSAGDYPLPWRPCPSANPRAPDTRPQTPADWGQTDRQITALNDCCNSIFFLLSFILCFLHVLLPVIVSCIIVILFCPAAMGDICILLRW